MQAFLAHLLLIVPFVFTLIGVYLLTEAACFNRYGKKAKGKVIDYAVRSDSDGDKSYHAIIKFTDRMEKEFTFEDSIGASSKLYGLGKKVSILYAPNNPAEAKVNSKFAKYVVPWTVFLFGTGMGILFTGTILNEFSMKFYPNSYAYWGSFWAYLFISFIAFFKMKKTILKKMEVKKEPLSSNKDYSTRRGV